MVALLERTVGPSTIGIQYSTFGPSVDFDLANLPSPGGSKKGRREKSQIRKKGGDGVKEGDRQGHGSIGKTHTEQDEGITRESGKHGKETAEHTVVGRDRQNRRRSGETEAGN